MSKRNIISNFISGILALVGISVVILLIAKKININTLFDIISEFLPAAIITCITLLIITILLKAITHIVSFMNKRMR